MRGNMRRYSESSAAADAHPAVPLIALLQVGPSADG